MLSYTDFYAAYANTNKKIITVNSDEKNRAYDLYYIWSDFKLYCFPFLY